MTWEGKWSFLSCCSLCFTMPSKRTFTQHFPSVQIPIDGQPLLQNVSVAPDIQQPHSLPKRSKNLGVRVIGRRIYDSENGRTCHQCRQKTIDFMAECRSIAGKKPCTQQFCNKCLHNRYGENVAEVARLETWTCPRCRGVCNCSICMKKQGRTPTGILSHTAKATGFNSVADLLQKCPDVKSASLNRSTPRKSVSSPISLTQGLKSSSKGSKQVFSKKLALPVKAPAPSTALVSLTNRDLCNGSLKGNYGTPNDDTAKKASKKSGLPDARVLETVNGTVDKGKGKRLTSDTDSKNNTQSADLKCCPVILAVSPSKSTVRKRKKIDEGKTASNGLDAEVKREQFGIPSEDPAEQDGKLDVPKPKKAMDGNDCSIEMKRSYSGSKRGDPITKKNASKKLTVTINGQVQGVDSCVSPETAKLSKLKPRQTPAETDGETASMATTHPGYPGKGVQIKAKSKKPKAMGKSMTEIGAVKLEEEADYKQSQEKHRYVPAKARKTKITDVKEEPTTEETLPVEGGVLDASTKKPKRRKAKVVVDAHADGTVVQTVEEQAKSKKHSKEHKRLKQSALESEDSSMEAVVLPSGEPLLSVAGLEVPPEAIGAALQLVEFCSAFNSVLGLKKGEVEALLREFSKGRLARRGSQSLVVQLHVKLLNFIVEDSLEPSTVTHASSGKNSWLQALRRHLDERSCLFTSNASKCDVDDSSLLRIQFGSSVLATPAKDLRVLKKAILEGAEGYEKLDLSYKLQLLVILCDDCLDTECLRNFIESANRKYRKDQKDSRQEILAARKEAKDARQKIRDAEATRLLAMSNVSGPLSPDEQEALLSKIQTETEKAVAAASVMTEAAAKPQKGRSDAVRTSPIVVVEDGRTFYKLKGAFDRNAVVLQGPANSDCSNNRPPSAQDCWTLYSEEEEFVLEKYTSSLRAKRIQRKREMEQSGVPEGGTPEDE